MILIMSDLFCKDPCPARNGQGNFFTGRWDPKIPTPHAVLAAEDTASPSANSTTCGPRTFDWAWLQVRKLLVTTRWYYDILWFNQLSYINYSSNIPYIMLINRCLSRWAYQFSFTSSRSGAGGQIATINENEASRSREPPSFSLSSAMLS